MNIVLCANTSWYIYNFRKNLMRVLRQHGHTVSVLAPVDRYSERFQALGIRWVPLHLHPTSMNPLRECGTLLRLWRILRSLRPDSVLTFTPKCNIYAGLIRSVCSFTHIANISGMGEMFDKKKPLKLLTQRLYRLALKRARAVFFQNAEDADTFLDLRLIAPSQCARLPGSGVDLTMFQPSGVAKIADGRRIFLMLGRLLPHKGYDLFLQAAQTVREHDGQCAEFWILGIPDTRRQASRQLLERILRFQQQKIVTLFPETDNVLPVLQQADVVVLPSQYHEGVPRSLLEAIACGKPLITTDWKGCRDTVEHGNNGLLVPPGDVEAFTRALKFFIDASDDTLARMGRASRNKAEREFDETIIIRQYLTALHNEMPGE